MASGNDKPQETATPSASTVSANETSRAKSIATRLTEAEFGEVEAAAAANGKKVAEWLREAALAHARASAGVEEQTDPILLAEIIGMRSLMLNLFARASEGPLTTDDLRKMSAYSDSIKEQRALDYMAQRRRRNSPKPRTGRDETLPYSLRISLADRVDPDSASVPPILRLLGMVAVGSSATATVLSDRILAQFRTRRTAWRQDSNPMAHGDGSRS
jgi:hypothetical protein